MAYFRELPNVEYQSFLSDKTGSDNYLLVKNLFRRVKLRDDLHNVFTIFDKYKIPDGSRPDIVAEELYGSAQYDWVVLICAGITRVRDQWPLSNRQLYSYAEELYGENLYDTHHYETIEVKDSKDRIILPKGKIVDENFSVTYYDESLGQSVTKIGLNVRVEVTNYQHEVRKNDEKRTIYVLKPIYLQQVLNDTRKAMIYDQSSQYVSEKVIKTENTRISIPN